MAGYAVSSQRAHWTFTQQALDELRAEKFAASDARRRAALAADGAAADAHAPKRARLDGGASSAAADAGPLSLADELRLQRHYERDVVRLCKAAGFDRAVLATAVVALKRFYLRSAPTEAPPSEVVNTAVLLGIKVEACPYTEFGPLFGRLVRYRGVTEADVVGHEVPMLQALRYQLTVYHPYRPLKTLLLDCIRDYVAAGSPAGTAAALAAAAGGASSSGAALPAGPHVPPTDERFTRQWDALQSRAFELVDVGLATDAPLTHSPAHVAAAALLVAARPLPRGQVQASSAAAASAADDGGDPAERVTLATLAPALAAALAGTAADPPPDVSWFVEPWLRQRLGRGPPLSEGPPDGASAAAGAEAPSSAAAAQPSSSLLSPSEVWAHVESAAGQLSDEVRQLADASATAGGSAYAASTAALEARLLAHLNPAVVEGAPQYAARQRALEAARAAYKAGKGAGRAAVTASLAAAAT